MILLKCRETSPKRVNKMSDFMVTSFQSDTAYSYWSVFISRLIVFLSSIIFLSNPYTLWVTSCPYFYEIFILLIELLKIAYEWIHSSFRFLLELESLFLHFMTIFHAYLFWQTVSSIIETNCLTACRQQSFQSLKKTFSQKS